MVNVIEYLKNFVTAKLNKISINFKFIKHLNGKKYIKGQAFAAPYQSFKIILLRPFDIKIAIFSWKFCGACMHVLHKNQVTTFPGICATKLTYIRREFYFTHLILHENWKRNFTASTLATFKIYLFLFYCITYPFIPIFHFGFSLAYK